MNILSFLIQNKPHSKQITKLHITKDIGTTIAIAIIAIAIHYFRQSFNKNHYHFNITTLLAITRC